MSRIVESYILLENHLAVEVAKLVDTQQIVLTTINRITDDTQKAVLLRYYIEDMTLEQIATDMNYSRMQICRIHGKALERIKDVIECYT